MEWIIQPEGKKNTKTSLSSLECCKFETADVNNTFMQNNMRMIFFCISNVLEFCPVLQIPQFQHRTRWSRVILEEVPRFDMLYRQWCNVLHVSWTDLWICDQSHSWRKNFRASFRKQNVSSFIWGRALEHKNLTWNFQQLPAGYPKWPSVVWGGFFGHFHTSHGHLHIK